MRLVGKPSKEFLKKIVSESVSTIILTLQSINVIFGSPVYLFIRQEVT